ncbi:glycosyltransferase family 2 protein [Terrimonas alba]|uniref:glycosyltransferase family 2 protein n=1 Tax=Terrimonas alba TaxID=3349636 RepID=UPI0035F49A95
MDISVIIVNYNVKHFLEQCLYAVQKASAGLETEIIVIDNNSSDNSINYLRPSFPDTRFIANTENFGFAKACNQGLQLATGKYILFLNPDTIVPEDCFQKCLAFFETHPGAGALGIKMIDGSGRFLKESKRSFPSPLTSLFKLFGLSRLFPHSRLFSSYHLGHLDKNNDHEIDVLAGAFMMIRKEVLKKTGGFDEIFFMYGEDVDLSYRIQKTPCDATGENYKNYYFSGSSIIHFKGESTKRGSMNYVRMFYNAMSIFVRKHYGGNRAGFFNLLIHLGIWIRAVLAGIGRFIRLVGLPLIDAGLIMLSFWTIRKIWGSYVRPEVQYDDRLLWIAIPAFTILYLLTAYYAGLYDRWYKRSELVRSTLIATIVLLACYSLLPEQYRFSRAIILFGAILSFIVIGLLRRILVASKVLAAAKQQEEHASTLIVASSSEYETVLQLMHDAGMKEKVLGRVAVTENDQSAIGYWSKLNLLYKAVPFKEVIFCEGTLSFKNIIEALEQSAGEKKIKIHATGSHSIVGSESKDSLGEYVSRENGLNLADPYNRRIKRLQDLFISFTAIISFPLHFIWVKKPLRFFTNCFGILFGQKTWVGYAADGKNLPDLRPAVLACNGIPKTIKQELSADSLQMIDYWYARDYEPVQDLKLVWKMYRRLGG